MNKKLFLLVVLLGVVLAMYCGLVSSFGNEDFGVNVIKGRIIDNNTWCHDTDGGLVFNVSGTVFGMGPLVNYSYDDYCYNDNKIKEYYCSGYGTWAAFSTYCTSYGYDGCRDGACVYFL